MITLSHSLAQSRLRWRNDADLSLLLLVIWPTTAASVRGLALALSHGVQIQNVQPGRGEPYSSLNGRNGLAALEFDVLAAYVREHTSVDMRVLSPTPISMSISTGRANALGFPGLLTVRPVPGPEYLDRQIARSGPTVAPGLPSICPAAPRWLPHVVLHRARVSAPRSSS